MSPESSRICSEIASHFGILNYQSQLENRLTLSLLSRYLTYRSVNSKKNILQKCRLLTKNHLSW